MELVILVAMLTLVALIGLGCFLLALAVAVRLVFPPAADAPSSADKEEAQRKPDPMDEGFENIMGYSVMGKTGFGDGDE